MTADLGSSRPAEGPPICESFVWDEEQGMFLANGAMWPYLISVHDPIEVLQLAPGCFSVKLTILNCWPFEAAEHESRPEFLVGGQRFPYALSDEAGVLFQASRDGSAVTLAFFAKKVEGLPIRYHCGRHLPRISEFTGRTVNCGISSPTVALANEHALFFHRPIEGEHEGRVACAGCGDLIAEPNCPVCCPAEAATR